MNMKQILALTAVCACGVGSLARAEKDAVLKPVISKPAKVALDEQFSGTRLPKGWAVKKGEFQARDGSLAGWEKKEDKHPAVLTLQRPFKNAVLCFSFKRDGATGFNVSLNHQKGHLFRILIQDDALVINKDKDKNDPNSAPVVLGKAEGKFPHGEWHTLQVEIVGDRVAVQADNGVKLDVRHPGLDVEKTGFRFVTRGSTLLLDDVTVWDVSH